MKKQDAFHLLLLNIMFVTILVSTYFSSTKILLSPGLGGTFSLRPFFGLFISGLVISIVIFFIIFYFLIHKIEDSKV